MVPLAAITAALPWWAVILLPIVVVSRSSAIWERVEVEDED